MRCSKPHAAPRPGSSTLGAARRWSGQWSGNPLRLVASWPGQLRSSLWQSGRCLPDTRILRADRAASAHPVAGTASSMVAIQSVCHCSHLADHDETRIYWPGGRGRSPSLDLSGLSPAGIALMVSIISVRLNGFLPHQALPGAIKSGVRQVGHAADLLILDELDSAVRPDSQDDLRELSESAEPTPGILCAPTRSGAPHCASLSVRISKHPHIRGTTGP